MKASGMSDRNTWLTFLLLLMVVVLVLSAPPAVWAVTCYLDKDHPQAADQPDHGTIDQPWKSFDYALYQLGPGDTLLVRAGVYTTIDTITLTSGNTGQEGAPITVKAYPGETAILDNAHTIFFEGANWWTFDGLIFQNYTSRGFVLGSHETLGDLSTAPAEHITIRNCIFRDSNRKCLSIRYGNHLLLENNHFQNVRPGEPFDVVGYEISAVGLKYLADDMVIRNNRFEEIGSDGIHLGTRDDADVRNVQIIGNEFWVNRPYTGILGNVGENGIDVKTVNGVVISGNSFHGFRSTMPGQDAHGSNGDGIVVHNNARNVIIEKNLFYDNTINLTISSGSDMIVRNNIFMTARADENKGYWEGGYGLVVRGFTEGEVVYPTTNISVYHNTFYDNEVYLRSWDVVGCTFKNNAIIGGADGVIPDNADWESDYNAWSGVIGEIPPMLQGANDIHADDLGLDPDLRPLPSSALIDAGQDVGVADDLDGNPRDDGAPDLGAFEALPPQLLSGLGETSAGWSEAFAKDYSHKDWLRVSWGAYNSANGEARVATGDIDGDGRDEIVLGLAPVAGDPAIPGGWFQVLDDDYTHLAWGRINWGAYNSANGESWPACGDVDGDGEDEIIIGLGPHPADGGWFEIFEYSSGRVAHKAWRRVNWGAYNGGGGQTRPACGDIDGDGSDEIIIGLDGSGGGWIEVFDDALAGYTHLAWGRINWGAYNSANGESWPACGDVDGDGEDELVIGLGPHPADGGWFEIFDYTPGHLAHKAWRRVNWGAYNSGGGETRPACGDVDRDGYDEIIVGLDGSGGGWLEVFDDASAGYVHLAWPHVHWGGYCSANGETWPAVKR